jgi:hypothetical protein
MAGHVFMSHGSDNREDAEALAAFLEGHGVAMWIAPRDVRPGQDYSEQLQGAIEGCVAFVVLVTEMANKSPYVRAETEMAFSGSKPIFPVRLTDIKPAAGLAFFLKIRHWTDAYGKSRDANLDRLAQELRTLSGAEAPAPEPAPAPVDAAPSPPPAPAPPPPPPPPPPAVAPDRELVAAALGPNADYFLKHWAKADASGKSYDWNWAACFLNFCWFAYRKMWLAAAAIGFIYVVTTPLLDPARNLRLFQVTMLALVGMSFVTGGWGNMFYRRQIDRRVAATAGMGRDEALAKLRKEGGTSVPGLVISIVATVLLSLVVSFMMLLASGKLPVGPAPAPDPAPAPAPAPAGPPALDEAYLVGRWSDSGDCNHGFEFTADGHFYGVDGGAGNWTLNGNVLTASGPGGMVSMQIQPIDRNTMTVTMNGQTSNPIRC